jgi:hypothetical protein
MKRNPLIDGIYDDGHHENLADRFPSAANQSSAERGSGKQGPKICWPSYAAVAYAIADTKNERYGWLKDEPESERASNTIRQVRNHSR